MVLFNHATREMTAKIVYYGPGLCGKTTNLMVIFDKLDPKSKGKMLSLATKTDRTLFFDLLPVDIGKIGNFNLKLQLYTVPGQVFYNETRKLVLKGADSVVFVADSQPKMIDSNRESFANLLENLRENQIDPNDIPIVIQYNKRDIPGVLPVEELQEKLGFDGYPYHEASALQGTGVMETFRLTSKITAKHLLARVKGAKTEPLREEKKPAGRVAARPPAKAAETLEPVVEEPATAAVLEFPALPSAPPLNPFAESVPFPESAPVDEGYEGVEEVSLEQLLEGRERPATISGAIPIPVSVDETVEDLVPEAIVEPEPESYPESYGVAVAEPQAATAAVAGTSRSIAALQAQVQELEGQLHILRKERRDALEDIARTLAELAERIRRYLAE
jgi:signal recognition particle receptor subunit beta